MLFVFRVLRLLLDKNRNLLGGFSERWENFSKVFSRAFSRTKSRCGDAGTERRRGDFSSEFGEGKTDVGLKSE
jgi:hypothetical protein